MPTQKGGIERSLPSSMIDPMPRVDCQKAEVYGAERRWAEAHGYEQLSLREAQSYAHRVAETPTWRSLASSNQSVIVRIDDSLGRRSYVEANGMFITLGHGHVTRPVVIHEMAHALTMRVFSGGVQDHGPQYMSVYRRLIHDLMSVKEAQLWESIFSGVRFDDARVQSRTIFATVTKM